jgi:hypothetical protein
MISSDEDDKDYYQPHYARTLKKGEKRKKPHKSLTEANNANQEGSLIIWLPYHRSTWDEENKRHRRVSQWMPLIS